MIQRIIFAALVVCLVATNVVAFSPATNQVRTTTTLLYSAAQRTTDVIPPITGEDTDDDVTCYVTNDEEIVTENEKPHVVCTSEPDDYAWFNGVDPKAMREVDETELKDVGAELCVEDENMKGVPEWECE